MKTIKFILSLILIVNVSEANWCKKIVSKAGTMASSAADAATKAGQAVSKKTGQAVDVVTSVDKETLLNAVNETTNFIEELKAECSKGGAMTAKICFSFLKESPFIIWRVKQFEPSVDSIREEIILPLADMLTRLKIPKSDESPDKIYTDFVIFIPEVAGKIMTSLPSSSLKFGFSALTGMVTANVKDEPGFLNAIRKDLQKAIMKTFLANLRKNEQNQHLNIIGRIQYASEQAMIWDGDAQLQEYFNGLLVELGFPKLKEALALYSSSKELENN